MYSPVERHAYHESSAAAQEKEPSKAEDKRDEATTEHNHPPDLRQVSEIPAPNFPRIVELLEQEVRLGWLGDLLVVLFRDQYTSIIARIRDARWVDACRGIGVVVLVHRDAAEQD